MKKREQKNLQKEKSYSPLRPLVDTNKIRINEKQFNPKDSSHLKVYNKFKKHANSPSITQPQRQLADFIIQNLAKPSDQLGNNPQKRYGALDYVDLREKPYIDRKTKERMDYYSGSLGERKDEQGIILSPFSTNKYPLNTNPLTVLSHEGVHALDDSYMRTHQNEVIDYLAKEKLSEGKPLDKLITDTQKILNEPAFSQGYTYDNFFKRPISTGLNNLKAKDFQAAQRSLQKDRKNNEDSGDNFMALSEFPAFAIEKLYTPWTASPNPQANKFLSKIIQGVQRNFQEFGLNNQEHPDIIQAFKAKENELNRQFNSQQLQHANLPKRQKLTSQIQMQQKNQKHFATGGYVNNNYGPYLNTDSYKPQLSLLDYPDNQISVDNMQSDKNMEDNILNTANITPNYYADGGMVENDQYSPLIALMGQEEPNQKETKPNTDNNPYPSLAEMIRQQGEGEDTVLAHINPIEAEMLRVMNGGKINPVTGLPQFGLFSNPKKWFKSIAGPAAGSIIGNMILPGIGGVIGGAFGGAAGSMARGRNDMGQAMLRGGAMGAMLPSAASLAGSGANSLGAKGLGATLSNYGAQNAVLPSIGLGNLGSSIGGTYASEAPISEIVGREAAQTASTEGAKSAAEKSFTDMLMDNSKSFFSQPSNLLTAAIVGGSLMNRPKQPREKSPEELAEERKRYEMGLMLTPQEQAAKEAADLAAEQSRRRIARNKFLPEERFNIEPLYVKTNNPEDYKTKGRWLEYYNNPEFTGSPVMMKEGGMAKPKISYEVEEISYPSGLGFYISGSSGGQDDKVPAMLSDGEYVIPADVLAHLGDGNNNSGAKKIDEMVKKIRTSKGMKNTLPPKAKSLTAYLGV